MAKQPKIRFKGFTEEWKEKTLGEQLIEINEKNDPKQTDFVISLTVKDGVIPYSEKGAVGNKAKEDHSQYKLAYPNTIVLNSMNILIGAIGICNYFGCVSPIYYVYKGAKDVDLSFVYRFMSTKRFQKNLRKYGNGILEIRLKVPTEDLMNRIIATPSPEEQKEISSYFDYIDQLIVQREKEVGKMKNVRRTLLEKIFPKEGESIPQIRFKGFDKKWGVKRLGEVSDKVTRKNINRSYSETFTNSAEHGIISQRDFFDHDITNDAHIDGYYIVDNDDFVYNPRVSTLAPVGPINRNKLGRSGVMSPLYTVFRPHDIDYGYLESFFKGNTWHAFMKLNGNSGARLDRFSISDNVFWTMPIHVPDDKEQQKVARLMQLLEQTISAWDRQVTLLKHYKQALLEQMFIYE